MIFFKQVSVHFHYLNRRAAMSGHIIEVKNIEQTFNTTVLFSKLES